MKQNCEAVLANRTMVQDYRTELSRGAEGSLNCYLLNQVTV